MSIIKACIFDLDGVIVDTAVYHYEAWRRLANQLGFDFTEEQNEELKGISRIESLKIILNWGNLQKDEDEIVALATLKNTWYVEMITKMTPSEILPGAQEFLELVREKGYKTALGSASKNSETILKQIGLFDHFDVLVDGNKVTKSKPDPAVFLAGAEELDVDPSTCVVFEDAIAGVQAALAGGMKVVGIGREDVLRGAGLVVAGLHEMTIDKLERL
ncbi:MAG: beta-phosphoglucomutase [Pedobacter sp.]|nr:MAG: beta-phosphoglucomutase [Pedobacter sp.]